MLECPSCALSVEKGEEVCPYCGYEFPQSPKSLKWFGIVFAFLMIWPLIKIIQFLW